MTINCYQCNSSSSADCNELFNAEDKNLKAQTCDNVYEARYCIKTTGVYAGLIGTQRFCASKNFGNYCEYIKRNGDQREQRSCVYTCSSDGCNSSNQNLINHFYLILSSFSIILSMISSMN